MLSPHRTARRSRMPASLPADPKTPLLDEMAHHMTTTDRFRAFLAGYLISDNPDQADTSRLDHMDGVRA